MENHHFPMVFLAILRQVSTGYQAHRPWDLRSASSSPPTLPWIAKRVSSSSTLDGESMSPAVRRFFTIGNNHQGATKHTCVCMCMYNIYIYIYIYITYISYIHVTHIYIYIWYVIRQSSHISLMTRCIVECLSIFIGGMITIATALVGVVQVAACRPWWKTMWEAGASVKWVVCHVMAIH